MFSLKNMVFEGIIHYPDIDIPCNQVTFICGESGSGKSTLLKLLNGVVSPSDGMVSYLGKSVMDYDSVALRREVLLVSQSVYLFDMSIKDNFITYYQYRDLEVVSDEDIKMFLNLCCIPLPLDTHCSVLSGGERHRIFTAIGLSFQPKVLMLDEPTSALDDKNAHHMIENIISFCRANKQTLIVVSHDVQLAQKYANHLILLSGGKINE